MGDDATVLVATVAYRSPTPPTTAMTRARALALVVLVLVSTGAPALVAATSHVTVAEVAYTGDGSIEAGEDDHQLWRTGSHEFTARLETGDRFEGEVCLHAASEGREPTTVACTAATVPQGTTANRSLGVGNWPENWTGTQDVTLVVRSNGSVVATSESLSVTVIEKDGDLDDDGLSNERELEVGSALRQADTDGDGLSDGEEVETHDTSPTNADTDGDGLTDRAVIEDHRTDPLAADTDDDGLPDEREVRVGTNPTEADSDGDGLADAVEVNTYETNATKADTDGDGLDDGAEIEQYESNPTDPDTDGDGLDDALEVNTYGTGPNTVDTDGDGLSDGAEVNDHQTDPTSADTDGDGLTDGQEVNTYGTSPTNADTDGDGLSDGAEINRFGTDPTSVDSDGDGLSDRAEVNTQPWSHLPLPVVVLGAIATVMSVAGGILYRSNREFDVPVPRLGTTSDGDQPIEGRDAPAGPDDNGEHADAVPPEFLSNEERIQQLLAANDGRMRQADIVDRTGWSKSKVSRVLSTMADQDEIVKVDVGKGNVITLPDRVPPGAQSPFDE